jgi:hypothetical protein
MAEDETVFILPPPKEEFQSLSEKEILSALSKSSRKKNPIVEEVARLVAAYVANFKSYVIQYGTEPFLLQITVSWPIEKIAVRLMAASLQTERETRKPKTLH